MSNGFEEAERVLLSALHARDGLQYAEVVELCAPESLAGFFRHYCETIRPISLEELREQYPQIREEDAPQVLSRFRAALGDKEQQLPSAVGVNSYEELCTLSPREFGRRWLEGNDSRVLMARFAPSTQTLAERRSLDYQIVERSQLDGEHLRLGYGVTSSTHGSGVGSTIGYEELVNVPALGWRLKFRALLLSPAGLQVEHLPSDTVRILGLDES